MLHTFWIIFPRFEKTSTSQRYKLLPIAFLTKENDIVINQLDMLVSTWSPTCFNTRNVGSWYCQKCSRNLRGGCCVWGTLKEQFGNLWSSGLETSPQQMIFLMHIHLFVSSFNLLNTQTIHPEPLRSYCKTK